VYLNFPTANFSAENFKARKAWHVIFRVLKDITSHVQHISKICISEMVKDTPKQTTPEGTYLYKTCTIRNTNSTSSNSRKKILREEILMNKRKS
jgi:hypothetical protein